MPAMVNATKTVTWKELRIDSGYTVYVSYDIVIYEDGVKLAGVPKTDILQPGMNISSYPVKIQNVINAAWAGL